MPLVRPPRPGEIIRFLQKIEVDPKTGCWNWTAWKDDRGYGGFNFGGPNSRVWAHRFAFGVFKGLLAMGMEIDHGKVCHNPSCVNPAHLDSVTPFENRSKTRRHVKEEKLPSKPNDDIPF